MSPDEWTDDLWKTTALELQRQHGGPIPYWRCANCLGPAPAGAWRHQDCGAVLALADRLSSSKS